MARSCPICRADVAADNESFPFCSPRCHDVDLGKWLDEAYRISRPLRPDEIDDVWHDVIKDRSTETE